MRNINNHFYFAQFDFVVKLMIWFMKIMLHSGINAVQKNSQGFVRNKRPNSNLTCVVAILSSHVIIKFDMILFPLPE